VSTVRVNSEERWPERESFPKDKDSMLEKISWMKKHPEVVRPQGLRGF